MSAQLGSWTRRARNRALVVCGAVGVAIGLGVEAWAAQWATVHFITYLALGLGVAFLLFRGVALPLIGRSADRRIAELAARYDVEPSALVWAARSFLV